MDEVPNTTNIVLSYTKKDIELIKEMWEDIFNDQDDFVEYYFNNVCKDNKILVAYDGDIPVGMVHLNTYKVNVLGKIEECIYIVGVAVKYKYRNQGIMRSMIKKIIADTNNLGNGFLFLMPEQQEYYTGLGFKKIYDTVTLECNIKYEDEVEEQVEREFEISGLGINNLSEYDEDGVGKIVDIVNDFLSKEYSVYSERTNEYMHSMLMEHRCQNGDVCIVKSGQDVVGLFSYGIYDGVLYAERVEILAGNVNDMFISALKLALENACVGCVMTIPADKLDNTVDIHGMELQIADGHGIMAYIPANNDKLTYEDLIGKSFFDEVV